jgi:hypothetical protein
MPTLLLTFANSETSRLKTLTDEYDKVSDALLEREVKGDFTVVSKQMVTRDRIYKEIRAREADISLFLFSGHAGADRLLLEDGIGHAEGIATLLGRCPNLKVVILNGCSTTGQVDLLLKQKVPIVIATSSPVGDATATQFSIALFNELSQQRLPIGEAFDRAITAAKVTGKIQQVDRGYRGLETGNDDESLWGIYYYDANKELITTWHLPLKPVQRVDVTEGVNDQLQGALVQIAMDNGITPTDATLDRLPYMIHHPIRKLLSPEGQGSFPFYDKPSWERFQMLLYAYRSIINLTTYALLAEAWEQIFKSPDDYKLSADCHKLIKESFFGEKQSEKQRSNLPLLEALGQVLKENPKSQFMTQYVSVLEEIEVAEPRRALDDLESKIKNQDHYQAYFLNPADALAFCLETENSLGVVLLVFGFWVKYSLTSIKDIGVLKDRHKEPPSFLHQLVALDYGTGNNRGNDKQYLNRTPLDTASVILHQYNDWKSGGLSLSPFVIDKNALDKAPKADLHYLLSFSAKLDDLLCYREARVHDYDRLWKILPEKESSRYDLTKKIEEDEEIKAYVNYHTRLKNQLIAFAKTVLHKKLEEL